MRLWCAYLAITAFVGSAYLLGPDQINIGPVFNVIGASAALAIVFGARRHLERGRLPWYLFAAGQLLFVSGDVLAYNYETFFHRELSFPSLADPFYLAVYPCLVAGLLMLIHRLDASRDRASLVDSLIVAVGVGTLSWVYLMAPYAHDGTLALPTKLISIAYPLMDLLVLAVVVRLAVTAGRRGAAFVLLSLGICALLATDAVYGWLLLHGGYETGGLLDGGWIAFYALFGAAALHPSMRRLAEPGAGTREAVGRPRMIALVLATLLAPGVEGVRLLLDQPSEAAVITAASAALFSLVMLRMAGLVRQQERARRREGTLRHAAEALVTASSCEAVHASALAAARSLAGPVGAVELLVAGDGGQIGGLTAQQRALLGEQAVVRCDGRLLFGIHVRDELPVVIAVGAADVPAETQAAIAALARETAHALESVSQTERIARERSEERFASLVRNASDIVCILAADTQIRYVSHSVGRVLGHDAETIVGARLIDLVHPDDHPHVLTILARAATADPATPLALEFRARDEGGDWHHLETLATNLTGDPSVAGVVLNARDISERKAFECQLSHEVLHDRLTGLPNRVLFRDRVSQALARQGRAEHAVAVLFLDLDDFKSVNDSLGHSAGDTLLREIGARIARSLRASDSAARLGGDEFAVLLDNVRDGIHAAEIAVRIMNAVNEPIVIEGHELFVHASVGIALDTDIPGDIGTDAILGNADAAMYLAKGRGKGRYHMFEPAMHDDAVQRLMLKGELRRALDDGELFVVYQPIVRLETGEIAGVEALVRWEHPQRGVVSPLDFIPIAEESGMIVRLGELVLRTACRDASALRGLDPDGPPLTVAVNLSAREMQQRQIVDSVRVVLDESGLPPERLIIELTESVMMQDMDLAILCMHELRQLGVRLAIDDFGTGYSSLNYVRQFPIDLLKIDRSFIQDVTEDGEISALTASIIELAHILELKPIAEGIENDDQLARLRALNCEFGQGFHLHRPMRAEELATVLREQRRVRSTAS
jgi:diguanylate cyclase (GGDEF)-like protein/PAS domain S-box-containing protein